jgi:hypothetical protein
VPDASQVVLRGLCAECAAAPALSAR